MAQDASGDETVAAKGTTRERLNIFQRIALFFRQVIAELRKVVTPTRKELITYTSVVLGFVIVMIAIVYGLDVLFSWVTTLVFGVPE